jgi:hypothetical protein
MTSKNPFEVRLDILKMSQEMLQSEHAAKEQKYLQKLDEFKRLNKGTYGQEITNFIEENAPTAYTPEEVITRASTLYSFVSSSTKNN